MMTCKEFVKNDIDSIESSIQSLNELKRKFTVMDKKSNDFIVEEDMICPVLKKHCNDECCTVGSTCNLSCEGLSDNVNENNGPEILVCECNSREHQMVIEHDDEYNETYCHIHLVKHSFWKRLQIGFKYIFGFKSKYGAFQEFIFKPEHADQIRRLLSNLSKDEGLTKNKLNQTSVSFVSEREYESMKNLGSNVIRFTQSNGIGFTVECLIGKDTWVNITDYNKW